MLPRVDSDVEAAVGDDRRVRVIVTFDRAQTHEQLAPFEVVFNLPSINAAALLVDRSDLDRLKADACVVRIEADGEIRAFD